MCTLSEVMASPTLGPEWWMWLRTSQLGASRMVERSISSVIAPEPYRPQMLFSIFGSKNATGRVVTADQSVHSIRLFSKRMPLPAELMRGCASAPKNEPGNTRKGWEGRGRAVNVGRVSAEDAWQAGSKEQSARGHSRRARGPGAGLQLKSVLLAGVLPFFRARVVGVGEARLAEHALGRRWVHEAQRVEAHVVHVVRDGGALAARIRRGRKEAERAHHNVRHAYHRERVLLDAAPHTQTVPAGAGEERSPRRQQQANAVQGSAVCDGWVGWVGL